MDRSRANAAQTWSRSEKRSANSWTWSRLASPFIATCADRMLAVPARRRWQRALLPAIIDSDLAEVCILAWSAVGKYLGHLPPHKMNGSPQAKVCRWRRAKDHINSAQLKIIQINHLFFNAINIICPYNAVVRNI